MTLEILFETLRSTPLLRAMTVSAGAMALGLLASFFVRRYLGYLADKTTNEYDDVLVDEVAGPIALSIAGAGVIHALHVLDWSDAVHHTARGLILSGVVLAWAVAAWRGVHVGLLGLEEHSDRFAFVKPRTTPMFEIGGKIIVIAGALYAFFLSWNIDLTAWLASAGILGIAVGFAAQETLGNVVAGMFILVEAPFKLGDWLELDGGTRGRVTDIGLRTTRLVTLDDVEIIVPNQVLANSRLTNESGGPYEKARITINVGVAYSSDIDKVRRVLLETAAQCPDIEQHPTPVVLFTAFGDSSLDFKLMVWASPYKRPKIIDTLHTTVFKRFEEEGIEIPFPQRDVWMRT